MILSYFSLLSCHLDFLCWRQAAVMRLTPSGLLLYLQVPLLLSCGRSLFFFTLEFCSDSHLEAQGLPPANPHSKPTLNCSKQEGGDRCFLTCQSQVHISSGELMLPHGHCHDGVFFELDYRSTGRHTVAVA